MIGAPGDAARFNSAIKGKIVLVGGDVSLDPVRTPIGPRPGFLVHATAMQNLLDQNPVRPIPSLPASLAVALATIAAFIRFGSRRARFLSSILPAALLLTLSAALFCLGSRTIFWLPLADGLLACAAAILALLIAEWWNRRKFHLRGKPAP